MKQLSLKECRLVQGGVAVLAVDEPLSSTPAYKSLISDSFISYAALQSTEDDDPPIIVQ